MSRDERKEEEEGEGGGRSTSQKAKGTKRVGNQNGWVLKGGRAQQPGLEGSE